MRLLTGSFIGYQRSIRKILLFLSLMVLFTLFTISRTDNLFSNDVDGNGMNHEPVWRPIHRKLIGWTGMSGIGLQPTRAALVNYAERRWYLNSNVTRILDTRILGGVLGGFWPENNLSDDRIETQLLYQPGVQLNAISAEESLINIDIRPRTIYLPDGLFAWSVGNGKTFFRTDQCPVNTCELTADRNAALTADAILFKHRINLGSKRSDHPNQQIWILNLLESPHHTGSFAAVRSAINWTATYRADSDIVTPYEKFVLHDPAVRTLPQSVDYAAAKSGKGKVAWFVSNCGGRNNRLAYAKELAKYISVDIFGTCGTKQCGRNRHSSCQEILKRDYKFYLAFENSNCRWYITEKFWVNALQSDVIPVVMGAPAEDYKLLAPFNSFIHVDDFDGPEKLAAYLNMLDSNATAYNEYFQWRNTGEFINTHFFCRLCSMLHSDRPETHYANVDEWWRGPSICKK